MYQYDLCQDEERRVYLTKTKFLSGKNTCFRTPQMIVELFEKNFAISKKAEEYLYLLVADTKMHLKGVFEISHGDTANTTVSQKQLFTRVLLLGGNNIILVHNHPSGICTPSEQDMRVQTATKKAGDLLGVNLCDNIIIGENCYYSAQETDSL